METRKGTSLHNVSKKLTTSFVAGTPAPDNATSIPVTQGQLPRNDKITHRPSDPKQRSLNSGNSGQPSVA